MLFQKIMQRGDSRPPKATNGSQRALCCWLFITTWFLFKGFELSPNNWPCERGLHLRAHNWLDAPDICVRLLEDQQVNLGSKSSVGLWELGDRRVLLALKPEVSMSILSRGNMDETESAVTALYTRDRRDRVSSVFGNGRPSEFGSCHKTELVFHIFSISKPVLSLRLGAGVE